jgi:NAD(P)-dependent dehydrogenase (short-subunit alcohol dehydrogenase family)
MADRLKNKVAIITGGGTGIGRAVALLFAREGAKVAICGRTLATLEDTAGYIRSQGGEVLVIEADVSDAHACQLLVEQTVAQFGHIDCLVNNAGVRASIGTILDLDENEWQRTFDIDAKGTWLCSRAVIPELRTRGGGSIIAVSSISAYIGQPKQGAYNAAKAAQELLVKCMAIDFAPDRIRVNSVCPAWIITEMNRAQVAEMQADPTKQFPPGISYQDLLKMHLLGRMGTPEDVAWAAVFLASDEAQWITGTALFVDGGYTCQ